MFADHLILLDQVPKLYLPYIKNTILK